MKKTLRIIMAIVVALLFALLIMNPVMAQKAQKTGEDHKTIPVEVMKIVNNSCISCHTEPGNRLALSHVNLSKWADYSPKKQAAKAKAMCKMVSRDKMPPKRYTQDNPKAMLTKDDIKKLCDWSASMQMSSKQKK